MSRQNGYYHVHTPALHSVTLSKLMKVPVYLKLENMQPSGSFKLRGVGNRCVKSVLKEGATSLVGSSGGNAGLAMAYTAQKLGVPITVFVPSTTAAFVVDRLKEYDAKVVIAGKNWNAVNGAALEESEKTSNCAFVHPFDHPDVWEGNATMIHELKEQVPMKPSCIVVGVGGGGLLAGLLHGISDVGWEDVPVLAMETVGTECYNMSLKAKKQVTLSGINSVATSFGALAVCQHLLDITPKYNIISQVVTDDKAVYACQQFLDDHRQLVEAACGASLSAVYCGIVPQLVKDGKLPPLKGPVIVIVCGGAAVTLEKLQQWIKMFDL